MSLTVNEFLKDVWMLTFLQDGFRLSTDVGLLAFSILDWSFCGLDFQLLQDLDQLGSSVGFGLVFTASRTNGFSESGLYQVFQSNWIGISQDVEPVGFA